MNLIIIILLIIITICIKILQYYGFFNNDDYQNIKDNFFKISEIKNKKLTSEANTYLKEIQNKLNLNSEGYHLYGNIDDLHIKISYDIMYGKIVYEFTAGTEKIPVITKCYEKIKTGDGTFDNNFIIFTNDKPECIARLSLDIRKLFSLYLNDIKEISLAKNYISISTWDKDLLTNNESQKYIMSLIKKILENNKSIENRLINNINNETIEEVRENNLKMLIESQLYIKYNKFIKKLENDKNPGIVILAASISKEKGLPKVINAIMNNRTRKIINMGLDILKKYPENNMVLDTYHKLLDFININIVKEVILCICELKKRKSIPYLLDIIQKRGKDINDEYVAIPLIKYFKELNVKKSINWLKTLFMTDNRYILLESINAVKIIGDINCIKDLTKIKNEHYDNAIKKAADDAIKYIQKDIPDDIRGNLEISNFDGIGNLSTNEDNGKLSTPDNNNYS